MTQTKREIRSLLAGAGIHPLKRFGQHFLIDGNLMRELVQAAGVTRTDVVLEVGPGTGALTEELLKTAGHVIAVEIDNGLHALCQQRFAALDSVTLFHRDVLETKSQIAPAILEALAQQQTHCGGRIMLVANLPYQIATPLLIDLLLNELAVSPLCFTVQAEVADRLLAPPGNKTYGPVSVFVQALARARRIARVPPEAFWPVPKVDSAMMRVDPIDPPVLTRAEQQRLSELVHGCFTHRRKTMKWSLRQLLSQTDLARVQQAGLLDLSQRPERIQVSEWVSLARWLVAG